MSRLASLPTKVTLATITSASDYPQLKASLDYLTIPGSAIAALASGNTLTIGAEFHHVTVATGNVDSISDPLGAVAGQQVRLLFDNAQTVRNNGGGSGNIRSKSGSDRTVAANEVLTLVYDGTYWREATT